MANETATVNKVRALMPTRRPKPRREYPKPIIRTFKTKATRPIDALRHPALDRQDPRYLNLGIEQDLVPVMTPERPKEVSLVPIIHPDSDLLKRSMLLPERRKQRGPEAIIRLFSKWHVSFELVDGQLVASSAGGALPTDSARQLLRDATPLIAAHLAGDPLRCAYDHGKAERPTAVSLVEPSLLPICGAHLDSDYDG